ncbi:MAG TPA: tRNA (adenosine(37)-N6)-dimethylallyltransferase MiaA, partial [Thermomicrobiales bacterium]|nr:tRNA (adenosine(37)-N6)-dimethylallyltransferase MiaA [Thermomicrobiales bacterium]
MTNESILVAKDTVNQQPAASTGAGAQAKPPLVVIAGATASGKTALALRLAGRFPIEIVNADSRAFYRGMDIGTAKPSIEERTRVPHHLVDILDPDEPMTLSVFQQMAMDAIADIHGRNRLPVLVGGTPQYVNALVEGWGIPQVPPNPSLRLELEREAGRDGVAALHERLRLVDPHAAAKTGPNLRRIVRALEVYLETGTPISHLQTRHDVSFDPLELELWWPREVLYRRIDNRVDDQIAAGLVDEVRGLLDAGYEPTLPSFSSIGYRQLVPAISGEISLAAAVERIKV